LHGFLGGSLCSGIGGSVCPEYTIPDNQVRSFLEVAKTNPLIDFKLVKDAGHFSFLSPFPAIIKDKVGLAARDPEGFDRENFHNRLQTEIHAFLNNKLNASR
jgi:hypothetical protein